MTEWKPIPNYEGFYEASTDGRIRSIRRLSRVNCKHDSLRWMGGDELKKMISRHGYEIVSLSKNGIVKNHQVHKLVLTSYAGPRPFPDAQCRHLDGIRHNNQLHNLLWGTSLENAQDKIRHGSALIGHRHHMAKLTNQQAIEIYQSEELGTVLAARYGISPTKISDIRKGRTWKKITGGIPLPSRKANQFGVY
jgi:hypothetical protein